MSEYSLDRMVTDFAGVLGAATETERVLIERVRQVRREHDGQRQPHIEARPTAQPQWLGAPPPATAPIAPSAPVFPPQTPLVSPPLGVVQPDWQTQPPPAALTPDLHDRQPAPEAHAGSGQAFSGPLAAPSAQPHDSEQPPGPELRRDPPPPYEGSPDTGSSGHRDYNYFAELDEKLTGLRERYLE